MGGSIWALLVAGSNTWKNYRHQADVCHAYQIFHDHDVPDDHIVVMMYDDIAFNADNPDPGVIINKIGGPNVYPGVPHDYVEKDVTPENFLKVLQGKDMSGVGSEKTIKSGPDDHVFVNFVDHGGTGVVCFPEDMLLTAEQLNEALMSMYKNKQYKQMVIYVEACHSGSMFEDLLPKYINVYATTASAADESSYACYYDKRLKVLLGDVYSVEWMKNTEEVDTGAETLEQQYEIVKRDTTGSHVQQFGNLDFDHRFLKVFMGSKHTLKKFPIPSASTFNTNSQKQNRKKEQESPSVNAITTTPHPYTKEPSLVQNQQYHYRTGDHGFSLAISASLCVFFFCWWIGLACTIPAISIAVNAQEAEGRGDTATTQSQQKLSQGLSITGIVSGIIIYILWILAVIINVAPASSRV